MEAHRRTRSGDQARARSWRQHIRLDHGLHARLLLHVRNRRAGATGMGDGNRAADYFGGRGVFHLLEFVAPRLGNTLGRFGQRGLRKRRHTAGDFLRVRQRWSSHSRQSLQTSKPPAKDDRRYQNKKGGDFSPPFSSLSCQTRSGLQVRRSLLQPRKQLVRRIRSMQPRFGDDVFRRNGLAVNALVGIVIRANRRAFERDAGEHAA